MERVKSTAPSRRSHKTGKGSAQKEDSEAGVGVGGYLGVLGGKEQVAAPAEAYAWRVWYENLHRLGLQLVVMANLPIVLG